MLAREGTGAELNAKLSRLRPVGLKKRFDIKQERSVIYRQTVEAQLNEQFAISILFLGCVDIDQPQMANEPFFLQLLEVEQTVQVTRILINPGVEL